MAYDAARIPTVGIDQEAAGAEPSPDEDHATQGLIAHP